MTSPRFPIFRKTVIRHLGLIGGAVLLLSTSGLRAQEAKPQEPPASGVLLALDDKFSAGEIKTDARIELTKLPDGTPAIRALFAADKNPTELTALHLPTPAGGWNLTGYTGIRMDVTNTTPQPVSVRFRIDNPDAKHSKFNANGGSVGANETKTISVEFGSSFGKAGYQLDPADVSGMFVYLNKPTAETVLLISNLRAYK